jgi:transcriptional regulator with XRE-family HTH domain
MFLLEFTIPIMGQRIRQLWADNRLPLEEVAEQVGCAPSFLAQVERNQAVSFASVLCSIAQALGVKATHSTLKHRRENPVDDPMVTLWAPTLPLF